MQDINNKSHLAIIIGSLDKLYNQARITGQINPEDFYCLNAIFKLLDSCSSAITYQQRKVLISIYNKLLYKSKHICPSVLQEYITQPKPKFIQDSSISNIIPNSDKILYWQESDYNNTLDDIILGLKDQIKLSDSYLNFANGKQIEYSNIGRISFLLNGVSSLNYAVIGEMGIDITSAFTLTYLDNINSLLITSNNIYSYGEVFIKITKKESIPVIIQNGIFTQQFNNTFK